MGGLLIFIGLIVLVIGVISLIKGKWQILHIPNRLVAIALVVAGLLLMPLGAAVSPSSSDQVGEGTPTSIAAASPSPTASPAPTQTPTPTATPTPTPTPTPEPTSTPAPLVFEGSGASVTPEFRISEGLIVFALHHDGTTNFAVKMFDEKSAENPSTVINEIGPFDGTVGWTCNGAPFSFAMSPGTYVLGIEADGNWTVSVTQPALTTGQALPITLSGSGHSVTDPFILTQGPRVFKLKNTPNSPFVNFIVRLLKADGGVEESVANELGGAYEGSKIIGIKADEAGVYVLSVRAEGDWSVSIE